MIHELAGQYIVNNTPKFCQTIAETIFTINQIQKKSNELNKDTLRELFRRDLMTLYFSIITQKKDHFTNYLKWRRRVHETRLLPTLVLRNHYFVFQDILLMEARVEFESLLKEYLDAGLSVYEKVLEFPKTYLDESVPHHEISQKYIQLVINGELQKAKDLVINELGVSIPYHEIYTTFIKNIQYEVGRLWELNKISIFQEHSATLAAYDLLSHVKTIQKSVDNGKTILLGCLSREMHEMGLLVLSGYLSLMGYRTIMKGANNTVDDMLSEIYKVRPHAVALSISTPVWIKPLQKLIYEIKKIPSPPKVIVGGYLFLEDPEAYKALGADGFSKDVEDAHTLLQRILS